MANTSSANLEQRTFKVAGRNYSVYRPKDRPVYYLKFWMLDPRTQQSKLRKFALGTTDLVVAKKRAKKIIENTHKKSGTYSTQSSRSARPARSATH